MKNREYRVLAAMALAAALAVGSIGAFLPAEASKEVRGAEQKTELRTGKAGTPAKQQNASERAAFKDETVYVKTDGDGAVKSVTVSDQLKHVTDAEQIRDVSFLTDIKNVKGDETFTQNGQNLIWKGAGQTICYQGTTTETLPVAVKVSYWLDGKEMRAEELEGKSGHLIIRYQYENRTKELKKAYSPFLMVTGVVLNEEKFTNIAVKNGKVLSDGERNIVFGLGIPQMKEALGTEKLNIPDYFELEADVQEYEAVQTVTAAMNDVFQEMNTEELDDLEDVKEAIHKLQDSSKQLVSGSGELKRGLDTLLASSGTLTEGIDKLVSGGKELSVGARALKEGSAELALGNRQLSQGTQQLLDGTNTLNTGVQELNAGIQTAEEKTKSMLLPGVRQLDDGVAQMQKELSGGMQALGTGVSGLHENLGVLREGTGALYAAFHTGTSQTGGVSLKNLASQTASDAAALAERMNVPVVQRAFEAAQEDDNLNETLAILETLLEDQAIQADETLRSAVSSALQQLYEEKETKHIIADNLHAELRESQEYAAAAQKVAQETAALSSAVSQLSDAAGRLHGGMTQAADGAAQLDETVNHASEGLGVKVTAGFHSLKQGTEAIRGGIDGTEGLAGGLGKLSAGAAQISGGSSELAKKMGEASKGVQRAEAGALQAADGISRLYGGAETLYGGLYTLKEGSDALLDGVGKLDEGASALHEGMLQFDEEGIEKLVNVFDGDIQRMLNQWNEMLDASKQYKSFSGLADEMEGQVKFIFVS